MEADINHDIYHLYCLKNDKKCYYDTALINDYNTSVLMNKYFRKIKENDNLDTIEESDSEDEFEDISEEKYMLNKTLIMKCVYLSQFNKWIPVRITNDNVITYDNLSIYKKKIMS